MSTAAAFYDRRVLFALRDVILDLDGEAEPATRLLAGAEVGGARRLGVLSGSFNPLTYAHTALAEALADSWP